MSEEVIVLSTDAFGGDIKERKLIGVHDEIQCKGRPCVIHMSTDHHMMYWDLLWRDDFSMFVRICPEHSHQHPDPDQFWYWEKTDQLHQKIHSCCGCCGNDGIQTRVYTQCYKCLNTGWHKYDDIHAKPCDFCCTHDKPRWQLTEAHGDPGKWCCGNGCGKIWDEER